MKSKAIIAMASLVMLLLTALPLTAHAAYYPSPYDYNRQNGLSWQNPVVRDATYGAGAGVLLGGLTGNPYDRGGSMMRSALIGGALGGGVGYLRKHGYLNNIGQRVSSLWNGSNSPQYNYVPNNNGYPPQGYQPY